MRRLLLPVALLLLASTAGAGTEWRSLPGLRAEVAALLMQGLPGGSLPIAAAVFPASEAGELPFLLELPPAPAGEAGGQLPLEVYAYAVDDAGEVVAHFAVALPHWPSEGDGLKIVGRLEAPTAALSVRFLVWEPASRRFGLVLRRVDPQGRAMPRIGEPCPGWTVADADASRLAELAARPVLVAGETQRLSLGPAVVGEWRVRLVGQGHEAAASQEVVASPAAAGGLEFVVPELASGVYQLSVVPAGQTAAGWPSLESWLVSGLPPAGDGCDRSWGRILEHARGGSPAPAAPSAEVAKDRRSLRRLVAGYEALLGRLANSGELGAAAQQLADFEEPIVAKNLARVRLLFAAEQRAAKRLSERDPRALLPLVALHAEAYSVHHGAGRFVLASHSRRVAMAILELASDSLEAPAERALLAVAITGLADLLEVRRASMEAQRLLERALALDRSLEAARLLLAVSYERRGLYQDARRQFEILASSNSAHYEARLRLAILLRRLDDTVEAERLLREVVVERPAAWLLALAYQTLGQLLIRDDRFEEALATIEDGIGMLPEDQVLQVLKAYALDRSGDRPALQRTLTDLRPGQAALTPRFRYSDEPAAELGLLRETLHQSVTVRWPLLALALAGESPKGEAP